MRYLATILLAAALCGGCLSAQNPTSANPATSSVSQQHADRQPFIDLTHPSKVFNGPRNFRLFLPPDYATSPQRYPVIYYFHGHSDRYTLEKYDDGKDTVPKIASFVAENPVIVVAVDGYVARDYTGFYGGSPWDVREEGGDFDFGVYFQELIAHIDANYRTLTDRRHRATSGLSMGGFASLWLSARYPQLIGSVSSFNSGPEFFTGDKGRRSLWRPKDHVPNHEQSMVRIIQASGDYISQYHEETRDAYAPSKVDFEFRRDEYHRHWATSIGETFAFHMRAFQNSALDNIPVSWSHTNPYRNFEVWGYQVAAEGEGKGFVYLENVTQCALQVRTRQWAPDGPPAERQIRITTASLYEPGASYVLLSHSLAKGKTERTELKADASGRLQLSFDGSGYVAGLSGPGCGAAPPMLLPLTSKDLLRPEPGKPVNLPLKLFNPRNEVQKDLRVLLSSDYPTVEILRKEITIPELGPGEVRDLSAEPHLRLTAGQGAYARAAINARIGFDDWQSVASPISFLIQPESIPTPVAYEVLDGRTIKLPVFRQKGNQGGGASTERTITEGTGNGNGILEPGETATIWVKLPQGLDPFDKNNWLRAKVRVDADVIQEVGDIQEEKQREFTGAKARTSLIRWNPNAPKGAPAQLVLDVESLSFHYTPDVHFGVERLYQAFQRHQSHLFRLDLRRP